jgi:hypothetical protein
MKRFVFIKDCLLLFVKMAAFWAEMGVAYLEINKRPVYMRSTYRSVYIQYAYIVGKYKLHLYELFKRQVWISIFHIIIIKKIHLHRIILIKKLMLDYYFCAKAGLVFLFQIFTIPPSRSQGK